MVDLSRRRLLQGSIAAPGLALRAQDDTGGQTKNDKARGPPARILTLLVGRQETAQTLSGAGMPGKEIMQIDPVTTRFAGQVLIDPILRTATASRLYPYDNWELLQSLGRRTGYQWQTIFEGTELEKQPVNVAIIVSVLLDDFDLALAGYVGRFLRHQGALTALIHPGVDGAGGSSDEEFGERYELAATESFDARVAAAATKSADDETVAVSIAGTVRTMFEWIAGYDASISSQARLQRALYRFPDAGNVPMRRRLSGRHSQDPAQPPKND
jgi:hypothetical protein